VRNNRRGTKHFSPDDRINMPSPILTGFILTLSVLVQGVAAIAALRLIRITGRWSAWSLIAAALALMAVRRAVPLFRLISGDLSHPPDPLNECIGLALSAAMAAGIARVAQSSSSERP